MRGLSIAAVAAVFVFYGCADERPRPPAPASPATCDVCLLPPPQCTGAATLRTFTSTTCDDGLCLLGYTDAMCDDGCAAGACAGADPCAGVSCDQPPARACADASTLVTYASSGTCAGGMCTYSSTTTACGNGCAMAACVGDPCAGVMCDQPPAAMCADAMTLRTHASAGQCNPATGDCSYAPMDTTCNQGCSQGACNQDPCAGVMCDQPPAPTCSDPQTLLSHDAPGSCAGGMCTYTERNTTCAEGCDQGACLPPSSISRYPGLTETQVDTGLAQGLSVASTEDRVMVLRTIDTATWSRGALAALSIDAQGNGTAVELTTGVYMVNGYPRAEFSADGSALYFVDVAQQPSRLVMANSDGSNQRVLNTGTTQRTWHRANRLFYLIDGPTPSSGNREVWAVDMPNGTPVQLVAPGDVYYPEVTPTADGQRALICGSNSSGCSIYDATTGTSVAVDTMGNVLGGLSLSSDGAWLAYRRVGDHVHLINLATGTNTLVASTIGWMLLSPDARFLAYTRRGASGWLGQVILHPLAGGNDVTLTAPMGTNWSSGLEFSDDGSLVVIQGQGKVAVAPVTGGAFTELTTTHSSRGSSTDPGSWVFSSGDQRIAINEDNRQVTVYPTTGGAGNTLMHPVDHEGHWEAVSSNPGLLVFTSPNRTQSGIYGSVVLYPNDGSGAGRVLPGNAMPAPILSQVYHRWPIPWTKSGHTGANGPYTWGWIGSAIVYQAYTRNVVGFDLVAATDDLATVGVVAAGIKVWAVWSYASRPARVFFAKSGMNGVWFSEFPQTPGR